MKTITAILVIFCAYLHVTDNYKLKTPMSVFENVVLNISGTVNDVARKVIPKCIFGVDSVSMVLFNRNIPYGKNIGVNDVCNDIDHSRPIFFLVHGFLSSANYTNSYKLSQALIEQNATVFSLDWSNAACTTGLPVLQFVGYPSAVQNTRKIGQHMANYVKSLNDKCNISLQKIIFIGHSLGAHITGFAAKEIQQMGYGVAPLIVAADPAQPLFMFNACNTRLCNTDAENLFVLHTSPLGITLPIGTTDLYFNGGFMQPSCSIDIACAHSRAVLYVADIIKYDCGFPGVPMTMSAITSIIPSELSYPQPSTTNCFVLDKTIFTKNRSFNKFKGKSYYIFVDPKSFCTTKNFNCER